MSNNLHISGGIIYFVSGTAIPTFSQSIDSEGDPMAHIIHPSSTNAAFKTSMELDPNDLGSFIISGSNPSSSIYMSSSGRFGFGTTDPKVGFDIKTDDFKIRSLDGKKEFLIDEEGRFKTRKYANKSSGDSVALELTGSELVMSYSPGSFRIPLKAQVGDIMGSVRWEDESYAAAILRSAATPMRIDGEIVASTSAGVAGNIIYLLSNPDALDAGPIETVRMKYGQVDITGSLTTTGNLTVKGSINASQITSSIISSSVIYSSGSNIFGDASTDTHTFNGNITASGNISSSGALSTFGEVVHLEGTDPRLKLKAKGANHPGVEWHEDSTRKWVLYNDPDESDSLVFKNDTTELVKISQTGNISSSLTSTGSFGRLEATSLTASIGEFDADTITIGGTIINKTIADNVRALLGTDAKTMAGNRVVISGPGGDIIASSISATELAYLGNVTSDIQSQLDSLAVTGSSVTFTNITASGNISASGEIIGTINGGSF